MDAVRSPLLSKPKYSGVHLGYNIKAVCCMSSSIVLWRIIFIPESITCRNVGQCGLSRTSCSQGRLGAAVQLWVVDIEEVGNV